MFYALGVDLPFFAQFIASKVGATGLTVTVDVWEIGSGTEIVTGGSATEIGDGLYRYTLAGASVDSAGAYLCVFKTADATVDQQHISSLNYAGINVPADAVAISGDTVAADRFETMLDGTGGNQLSLGKLVISGSGTVLDIQGGGVNSPAARIQAINASGVGHALRLDGQGTGNGLFAIGGVQGNGILAQGGSTSGDGIRAIAATSGDGIEAVGAGGGADINAGELKRILGLQGKFVGVRNVTHDGNGDLLTMDIIVYDTLANAATNDGATGLVYKYSVVNTYSAAGLLATSVTTQVT